MTLWKTTQQVHKFLTGIRAALPLAEEQLTVMMTIIHAARQDAGVTTFLDLGCGDGILGAKLYETYPDAEGTFIDFSEPMLEAAKARHADAHAHFYHADLTQPAWGDLVKTHAPFDVVVSGYAIHHIPDDDKKAVYQAVYDLLSPNGVFINVEHVTSPSQWLEDIFEDSVFEGRYLQARANDANVTRDQIKAEFDRLPDDGDICATVEDQCEWLREMGFKHVDCYMKIFALAVFGGVKQSAE